jgi:hypothetical protein
MKSRFTLSAFVFLLAFSSRFAFAGTIITNLTDGAAIVNIDARVDGSDLISQALWRSPFSTGGPSQLLRLNVTPGMYQFVIIDPTDAKALFPSLTSIETNQIFTAWTYNSPWITDYLVFDSAAATNNTIYQLFDGAFGVRSFNNASNAYHGMIADGYADVLRVGPLGRNSTNYVTHYTFTNDATLIFVIPDNILSDNNGGVSVLVRPVVPLSITASGDSALLTWPTNHAEQFYLEQKTNLNDAAWSTVSDPVSIVNSNYAVTLPLDPSLRFFRLQHL